MMKTRSLAWNILAVILLTSIAVSGGVTVFTATTFWHDLERDHLSRLDDYITQRGLRTQALFNTISTTHEVANHALLARLEGLPDERVAAEFDQLFPINADGTRRSTDALYDGYFDATGDRHSGVGAFMGESAEMDTDHKRLLLAAYHVVDRGGEMLGGQLDNLYFFTPQDELIISAATRPDQLMFYRHNAPADFTFTDAAFFSMVLPDANPQGVFVCDDLSRLIYVQTRQALTTGCFTPFRINGEHLGAFGTTIQLGSYFAEAMADAPNDGENLFIDSTGGLISHRELIDVEVTPEAVAAISERLDLESVFASIAADGENHGTVVSNDGSQVIAYAWLPGMDWYFVSLIDRSVLRAAISQQVIFIVTLGLFGLGLQALIIYLFLFRQVVTPLAILTRQFGKTVQSPLTPDPALTEIMRSGHEVGALARTLDRQRRANEGLFETLERRVEERTRALESANQAKDEFLANMSHELRTPLNGVLGLARIIQSSTEIDQNHEHARMIQSCGETLTLLLNDVLDMAKIEAGQMALAPEPIDLRGLLADTFNLFARTGEDKGLDCRLEIASDVPDKVQADALRVRQCLSNLLSNAIKFTSAGTVIMRVGRVPTGETDMLAIEVEDTGTGISPASLEALFAPFVQASNSISADFGGTGLGLTIARRLARMMHGDITARSALGEGACFRFTFHAPPSILAEPATAILDPVALASDSTYGPLLGLRILLVEDNFINRQVARAFLKPLGAIITEAGDGQKALDCLQLGEFDLVLMDVRMPVMNGLEATRAIRASGAAWSRLPVIALTANTGTRDADDCIAAGMDHCVAKPLRAPDLFGAMLDAVSAEGAGAARNDTAGKPSGDST
jgi:signal transduction histidine kinase/ActR/RegA family two-component response regulator